MAILRASDSRATRWKNGGGETRAIAISPTGAGLDNFHWRISMATVSVDGPFSTFTGVDRTLCILDGAGIELSIDDEPVRHLDPSSAPLAFSGDAATHSKLIRGPVTDFNVMTRRDHFRHRVERVQLQAKDARDLHSDILAIFCQAGVVSTASAGVRERLERFDTMIRAASDREVWRLCAGTTATVCLVSIVEHDTMG